MRNPPKDLLTVLLFKDNHAPRTFRVPISWVLRFGLSLVAAISVFIFSLVLAVKFFTASRNVPQGSGEGAERILTLERELGQAREQLQAQQQALASATQASVAAQVPAPVPTVYVTVTPSLSVQQLPGSGVAAPGGSALLFGALPAETVRAARVPVSLTAPELTWSSNRIKIRFSISYSDTDNGRQQGRIVILARGPDSLLAYPAGALNGVDQPALVAPNRGEYFSVSRFREVEADFGPFKSRQALAQVQILLFSENGQLLLSQSVVVPK